MMAAPRRVRRAPVGRRSGSGAAGGGREVYASGVRARGERRSASLAAAVLAVAAVAAGGCYSFSEPSLRPGNARDIVGALGRRGVTVSASLAGDSACADPGLVANALRITASVPPDPKPHDVFVYSFRLKSWDESLAAVDACQAEFESSHPDAAVTRVDVPTYRAFGADWPDELTTAVRGALEEASQAGA
jgi:hypothetical protein